MFVINRVYFYPFNAIKLLLNIMLSLVILIKFLTICRVHSIVVPECFTSNCHLFYDNRPRSLACPNIRVRNEVCFYDLFVLKIVVVRILRRCRSVKHFWGTASSSLHINVKFKFCIFSNI